MTTTQALALAPILGPILGLIIGTLAAHAYLNGPDQ